ncbi:hypothetical protein IIA95_02390 [Patescibacteria group bacterium]|nr:hypothetical protein [Patescibacteria group bacterium]
MGLLEQIEKIQKKPKAMRIQILIAGVAVIMAIIILVWIQSMRYTFSKSSPAIETKEITRPLMLLWQTARESFSDLKNQFQNFRKNNE